MPKLPEERRGRVVCISLSQRGRDILSATANAYGCSMSKVAELAIIQLGDKEAHRGGSDNSHPTLVLSDSTRVGDGSGVDVFRGPKGAPFDP